MDKLYISFNYEIISIEFEKIYYKEDIQSAISGFYDYLDYDKDLSKCVNFVKNNSNLLQFMAKAVENNIIYFLKRKSINKILLEYAERTFGNLTKEQIKMLNKPMAIEGAFSDMLKKEFLKVKQLMLGLDENIMNVLKEEDK